MVNGPLASGNGEQSRPDLTTRQTNEDYSDAFH